MILFMLCNLLSFSRSKDLSCHKDFMKASNASFIAFDEDRSLLVITVSNFNCVLSFIRFVSNCCVEQFRKYIYS